MAYTSSGNPFQAGTTLLETAAKRLRDITLDITWVVSASLSMRALWKTLAYDITNINAMINHSLPSKIQSRLRTVRVRFIAYRDLYMDSAALECSPFFDICTQGDALVEFIHGIRVFGGGIAKKSGMEALFCAIHGDWLWDERDNRQIVCLITDAEAYLPEDPQRRAGQYYIELMNHYTTDVCEVMPDDMDGMRRLWRDGAGTLDNWKSNLVLLTRPGKPWEDMVQWPRVLWTPFDTQAIHQLSLKSIIAETCRPLNGVHFN